MQLRASATYVNSSPPVDVVVVNEAGARRLGNQVAARQTKARQRRIRADAACSEKEVIQEKS